MQALRCREGQRSQSNCPKETCPWKADTIDCLLWFCIYTKAVWEKVNQLHWMVTGVKTMTREAALYGHLTKE